MPSAITRRGTCVSWNGGHGLQVFAGRLFAFSCEPRLLALPGGAATWLVGSPSIQFHEYNRVLVRPAATRRAPRRSVPGHVASPRATRTPRRAAGRHRGRERARLGRRLARRATANYTRRKTRRKPKRAKRAPRNARARFSAHRPRRPRRRKRSRFRPSAPASSSQRWYPRIRNRVIARSRTCCDRRSGGSTRKDGPTATNSEIAKPRNRRGAFCSARRVSVSFARRTKTNSSSPMAPSRRFARTARSRRTRADGERETDTSWPSRRASRPSTTFLRLTTRTLLRASRTSP